MNTQATAYVLESILREDIEAEKNGYYDSDWRYDAIGNYWNFQIEVDSAPTRIVGKTPLILFADPSEYGIIERKVCPYRNPECDHECYVGDEYEGPEGMEQYITECSCLEEVFESTITGHTYSYDGFDVDVKPHINIFADQSDRDLPF